MRLENISTGLFLATVSEMDLVDYGAAQRRAWRQDPHGHVEDCIHQQSERDQGRRSIHTEPLIGKPWSSNNILCLSTKTNNDSQPAMLQVHNQ